jgi:6-pyruvoyltetrahydropterin/6-carboxytetrahydropterin synthase
MFELKVKTHFSAAHRVLEHSGKCANLHGHNWNVEVTVQAQDLNRIGLAVDFSDLKAVVKDVLGPLDHVYLNELPQFSTVEKNPTAENVARHVFEEVRGRLRGLAPHATVKRVDVFETDTCSASFFE